MVEFRHAYSEPLRVSYVCVGESRTQQNFQAECDINNIVRRYQKTGLVGHVNNKTGEFMDLSAPIDYRSAVETVQAANDSFMGLPSEVRSQFGNDPAAFVDFMSDPRNLDKAVAMGLAIAPDKASEPVSESPATPVAE